MSERKTSIDIEGKVMHTVASRDVHFLSEADSRQNALDCCEWEGNDIPHARD